MKSLLVLFAMAFAGCAVTSPGTLAVPDQPPRGATGSSPSAIPVIVDPIATEMNAYDAFAADLGACTASSEDLGACANGDYLVYCHGGRLHGMDCSLFEGFDDSAGRCTTEGALTSCYVRAP